MNVELFCCSGGMAEGFRRAGILFDIAVDADADACASYAQNLGHEPVHTDVAAWLDSFMARGPVEPVDLLVADPPCVPWSRAGSGRGLDDERDCLLLTCEAIRRIRPRSWMIANIPGLEDAPNARMVQRTIGALAEHGYCIDFALLDAADYGVAQHRVRPFWFGHHGGAHLRWPERTHRDPAWLCTLSLPGFAPLRPWVSVREALSDLSPEDLGRPVRLRKRDCNGKQHGSVLERPARGVGTSNLSDGNVLLDPPHTYNPKHPPALLDRPSPTVAAKVRGAQGGQAVLLEPPRNHPPSRPDEPAMVVRDGGGAGLPTGWIVSPWPWDRPATVVHADPRIAPPGQHSKSRMSAPNAVVLSERAAARLQGFPDGWVFAGKTKGSRWSQIGQALPPPLAEVVARSVEARAVGGDP